MLKQTLITIFLMHLFFNICAQDNFIMNEDNGTNLNVLYRNDASGKIYLTPRGMGFMFRQAKHVTVKTRSYYEVDLQALKHPKEIKTIGTSVTKKRFVYGKLNNVLLLRGALGLQKTIHAKGDIKAVEIRYSYSLGPTFAFAKPYYVKVNRRLSGSYPLPAEQIVKFDADNFTVDSIAGRGGFLKGLEEIKVYPAVTAKFNLSFEYAPYTNLIRAIETGISVDYFPKSLPIMARNNSENLIITLHLGFVFGQKWY
jgi:hypothetical protein